VVSLGKWFARFHALSKQFVAEHPDLYARTRNWTELHDGVLAGAPIDELDVEGAKDKEKFGLIHGDVNVSNYFWVPATSLPHVFDWDQVCTTPLPPSPPSPPSPPFFFFFCIQNSL
jgi:Ser/Thr protein kinase RdoA (MazF antagonist)